MRVIQLISNLWYFVFRKYMRSRTPLLFGEALRDIREEREFTQERVARRINIGFEICNEGRSIVEDTVGNWENSRRVPRSFKITQINLIADALKCSDTERAKLHLSFLYTLWKDYQDG